jgi:hypothetical protein
VKRSSWSKSADSSDNTGLHRDENDAWKPRAFLVVIRCKQWEDFKAQASGATTVSFLYQSEEKAFQVEAIKDGNIYTFSGRIPNYPPLLAAWLSKQLIIEEKRVVEGTLTVS